jgi:hypothetical protein
MDGREGAGSGQVDGIHRLAELRILPRVPRGAPAASRVRQYADARHRRRPAMCGDGPQPRVRPAGTRRVRRRTRMQDQRGCRARSWRRVRVEVVTRSTAVRSTAQESTGGDAKPADAGAAHWRPAAMKGGGALGAGSPRPSRHALNRRIQCPWVEATVGADGSAGPRLVRAGVAQRPEAHLVGS